VGASRAIVVAMTNSLKTFINDNKVVFESYRVEAIQLEPRTDIPLARISLHEDSESAIDAVNNRRPNLSNQTYLIDVSVVRAYQGDKANRGELIMLDLCDKIKEWLKTTDFGTLTNLYLVSVAYSSSTRAIRNPKYVTRTLVLTARRDLYMNQTFDTFDYNLDVEFTQ
jgi:hypothetical protein